MDSKCFPLLLQAQREGKLQFWENIASVGFHFPLAVLMAPQPSAMACADVQ